MTVRPLNSFSIPQARAAIGDLFDRKAAIYWLDFAVTISVGYGCAMLFMRSPGWSAQQAVTYLVAGFALFRLGSFIHEIVHFRHGEMRVFQVVWNALVGVPMLAPTFFYNNHIDHHNAQHYGTGQDGEYLPLASGPWHNLVYFFAQVFALPVVQFLRFLVLAPLSFLHSALRTWTLERASAFVINLRYRGHIPPNAPRGWWATMEVACFLRCAYPLVGIATGFVPWTRLVQLYALAVLAMGLNYLRNLVAHRYRGTGELMTHAEQLADSVNVTGRPLLTELFFPLGLRYHALHHLFPALPYHCLGIAHRRLMAMLPAESAYRQTVYPSYRAAVFALWLDTKRAAQDDGAGARHWRARREELLARRSGRSQLGQHLARSGPAARLHSAVREEAEQAAI